MANNYNYKCYVGVVNGRGLNQPLSGSALHTNCPLTLETLDQLILKLFRNTGTCKMKNI